MHPILGCITGSKHSKLPHKLKKDVEFNYCDEDFLGHGREEQNIEKLHNKKIVMQYYDTKLTLN